MLEYAMPDFIENVYEENQKYIDNLNLKRNVRAGHAALTPQIDREELHRGHK